MNVVRVGICLLDEVGMGVLLIRWFVVGRGIGRRMWNLMGMVVGILLIGNGGNLCRVNIMGLVLICLVRLVGRLIGLMGMWRYGLLLAVGMLLTMISRLIWLLVGVGLIEMGNWLVAMYTHDYMERKYTGTDMEYGIPLDTKLGENTNDRTDWVPFDDKIMEMDDDLWMCCSSTSLVTSPTVPPVVMTSTGASPVLYVVFARWWVVVPTVIVSDTVHREMDCWTDVTIDRNGKLVDGMYSCFVRVEIRMVGCIGLLDR